MLEGRIYECRDEGRTGAERWDEGILEGENENMNGATKVCEGGWLSVGMGNGRIWGRGRAIVLRG